LDALVPVLQLVNQFAPGGAESQFVARLRSHPRGFRPVVGALQRGGELSAEVDELGLRVEYFGLRGKLGQLNTGHQMLRIAALIEREGVRLVHANDFYTNVLAVPAARLAGARVICSRWDLAHSYGRPRHFVEAAACRAADAVVANARAVREMLVAEEGVPGERVEVLSNAIDLAAFDAALRAPLSSPRPPQLTPGSDGRFARPTVVVPASLSPVKGHLDLVEAAELVKKSVPGALFLCAGEGPMRPALEQQIGERGLRDCVLLLGRRRDVPALLSRAHAGCLPSHAEGLSNAIIESMAAGLPVVATRVGGNAELVEEGPGPETTGHLVPAYRPTLLAQALIGLLKDPERSRVFGAAGRKLVEARLTAAALSARMGDLYARVLAGPRRAGVWSAARGAAAAVAPTAAGGMEALAGA
jgi:glycosyltransferase involved in cell wall biosynthesis